MTGTSAKPDPRAFVPADRRRRSQIQRWSDTIAALVDIQAEYARWVEALPDNQQDSAMAEASQATVKLDLGVSDDRTTSGFRP